MGVRYPIIWPDCLGKGSLCASATFIRNLLSWLPCVLFFRSNCMFAVWFGKKNSRQVCNQIWKVEKLFLIVAELLIWISLRLADLLVLKFVWLWQKYQTIWICEPFPCDESRIEAPFHHNNIFFWDQSVNSHRLLLSISFLICWVKVCLGSLGCPQFCLRGKKSKRSHLYRYL